MEKETLTLNEIKIDLESALLNPSSPGEDFHTKWDALVKFGLLGFIALAVLLGIFVNPWFFLAAPFALVAFVIASLAALALREKARRQYVLGGNYDIGRETVYSLDEEHFERKDRMRTLFLPNSLNVFLRREVNCYTVRMESGKVWRIPKKLYTWTKRQGITNEATYAALHRGDEMITVSERGTGVILIAYAVRLFSYKEL